MSLSIEIRVNGHPVAALVAHNTGRITEHGQAIYDGQAVEFKEFVEPVAVRLVGVWHYRRDGIVRLAKELMARWAEKL